MNGISWTRKLFPDVHWLVLNGNYIAILETKGDIYISYSFLPRYRQLDDLDPLMHQVQVQTRVRKELQRIINLVIILVNVI